MSVRTGAKRLKRRVAAIIRDRLVVPGGDLAGVATAAGSAHSHAAMHQTRAAVANAFLHGDGIEIGALHQPLPVPPAARVKYVDRMTASDLRRHYEELAAQPLVEVDIIDDGERLTRLESSSQDFVIANHFIEHCQNPILTVKNLFRVLKAGGVLYMAVPDKRFTFDIDRPCTTIEHLTRDFVEGPEWSRRQHFEEWSRLVNKQPDQKAVETETQRLMEMDYSIHFHVWEAADLMAFVVALQDHASFEADLFLRNGPETLMVLRKV
jgi:predicted SAM-dependent methyltransferase